MNDEQLFERLANHDGSAALDASFEGRLYSILQREMRPRRSLRPALLLVAAVVVLAIVGYRAFFGPHVGGPSPSETAQPTSTPATSAAPEGPLEPGSFTLVVVEEVPLAVTVSVQAADWYGVSGGGTLLKRDSAEPPDGAGFIVFTGNLEVYGDPCAWATSRPDPPTGPTVDDLVAALSLQPGRDATAPTDITVDGYSGKAIELTVPADIAFATCDLGEFRSWQYPDGSPRWHQGPGQHDLLWILDVKGLRVVIDAGFYEGTSPADRAEQQAILDSIQFKT
jgi:hypothetical protein